MTRAPRLLGLALAGVALVLGGALLGRRRGDIIAVGRVIDRALPEDEFQGSLPDEDLDALDRTAVLMPTAPMASVIGPAAGVVAAGLLDDDAPPADDTASDPRRAD